YDGLARHRCGVPPECGARRKHAGRVVGDAPRVRFGGNARDSRGTCAMSNAEPSRQPRALVADHDPVVRQLVVSVLAELGTESRACASGADAWRTFEEWLPELVVIDADLPIVDGVEICRRIREWDEKREVFVLVLTG